MKKNVIGEGTIIYKPVNIYGSRIGKNCKIAAFVEVGGAVIGDGCKIEAFVFIPPGVEIGNNVFVGPHTCFTNDRFPSASAKVWRLERIVVEDGASIGANCTIRCGVVIGKGALIGAGSIVTKNVPPNSLVYGDYAKAKGEVEKVETK